MPRLFWKFFIIIWLTMTGSVIGVFALTSMLQIPPFIKEVDSRQRLYSLDVAERLLRQDGETAAQAFAGAGRSTPHAIDLAIGRASSTTPCASESNERFRAVQVGSACYLLQIKAADVGILKTRWPQLVPWLLAMIASAVSAFWLARYLIRPVVHLRRGLSALAQGRFDVRIGSLMGRRKDEVTDLAHDFDVSASRLRDLQNNQQRLFHDVSHELRSPLSRMQAAIGVLRQNPARLASMVERMEREIERIDTLIGEILTLARLASSSNTPLEYQELDLIDLLHDILEDAKFECAAKDVQIDADVKGSFITRANGELIYRALENVIRNAVKYTADASVVTVECSITVETLRVRVSDEGPGVPEQDLETIFRPFLRGSDRLADGGYGLGLAISRHALERHGGHIGAAVRASGGLMITIDIPRSATV